MPAFDVKSPETKQALADALVVFKADLVKVKQALQRSEGSSARWAQPGRERAGLHNASLRAAMAVSECSLDNLENFANVNHAFFTAGEQCLMGDESLMTAQAISTEIVKAQHYSAETRNQTNKLLQKPEALGINANTIAQGDAFGVLDPDYPDPYKNVVIAAAAALEGRRLAVDTSTLALESGPAPAA